MDLLENKLERFVARESEKKLERQVSFHNGFLLGVVLGTSISVLMLLALVLIARLR
jgi:tetrahydromethanopterin S-methyltransferase subunit G